MRFLRTGKDECLADCALTRLNSLRDSKVQAFLSASEQANGSEVRRWKRKQRTLF